jgi:hypothetical protein
MIEKTLAREFEGDMSSHSDTEFLTRQKGSDIGLQTLDSLSVK